jgi:chemotaxis protein methyltransferase WspC
MMQFVLEQLEQVLKQSIGLDAASIGQNSVARALEQRQAACGLAQADDYLELLQRSEAELQQLIEAVVVPETWFFRDREAFAALAERVAQPWLASHAEGCLQLLSLPCASGEEPYSMAMALLDAGVPPERFRIDAVDISLRVLASAEQGLYGKNSLRGGEQNFLLRYFDPAGTHYRLRDEVRRQVSFRQGNLLDPGFAAGSPAYHVIFCRNLLIYFDRATQERAVAQLARLLRPDGVLFVGPSETGLLLSQEFSSNKWPLAFAFRPGAPAPQTPRPTSAARKPIVRSPAAQPRHVPRTPPPPPLQVAPTADQDKLPDLATAARLADQGHLAEAARIAEAHLQRRGAGTEALQLLALIYDASGQHDEAQRCYRKVLYLDPNHLEALTHLIFMLEQQGDRQGAAQLRARAQRLQQRGAAG